MIAFTRDPSGSRASTNGELSSTWRPSGATIRSMAPSTARGELKPFCARSRRPARSTYTSDGAFTMISLTVSSAR